MYIFRLHEKFREVTSPLMVALMIKSFIAIAIALFKSTEVSSYSGLKQNEWITQHFKFFSSINNRGILLFFSSNNYNYSLF